MEQSFKVWSGMHFLDFSPVNTSLVFPQLCSPESQQFKLMSETPPPDLILANAAVDFSIPDMLATYPPTFSYPLEPRRSGNFGDGGSGGTPVGNHGNFGFEPLMSINQTIAAMDLDPQFETRPTRVTANDATNFFNRNMEFVSPFLDENTFRESLVTATGEYKEFEAEGNSKNKCRGFWKAKIQPLVDKIGDKFQRVALMGSLNGLTPEVARKFYALLIMIGRLPDDEAAIMLDAFWLTAAIGECDPYMQVFPNH
jgi:hypothetical protein